MKEQGFNGQARLALGCMGVLVGIAVACGGESPVSPSTVTEVGSPLESSSNFQSLEVGSSTLVNARENDGGNGKGGGRTGEAGENERRLQYCKSLQQGDENYERCQTWLNSRRGDDSRGRAGEKKRRLQYCKNLQQGDENYERCQTWLKSERGDDSRGRAGEKERKLQYCKNLQQGHENYERCQAWLNPEKSRRGQRQK